MKLLITISMLVVLKTCGKIDDLEIPEMPPPGESTSYTVPEWAPEGSSPKTRYYYFPDYEVYYYTPTSLWVYYDGKKWKNDRSRPSWFVNTNLRSANRMGLDYFGSWPWLKHDTYYYMYPPRAEFIKGRPSHPHGMPPGQAKKEFGSPLEGNKHDNGHPNQGVKGSQQPNNPHPLQGPKSNPGQKGNPTPNKTPVKQPGGQNNGIGNGNPKGK